MQIRIWQLLYLMILVALLFATINWLGGWAVIAIAISIVVLCAFGMPIVILVLAIALSSEVNKQLDVRSNKALAVCMAIWLVCVAILLVLMSVVSFAAFW